MVVSVGETVMLFVEPPLDHTQSVAPIDVAESVVELPVHRFWFPEKEILAGDGLELILNELLAHCPIL